MNLYIRIIFKKIYIIKNLLIDFIPIYGSNIYLIWSSCVFSMWYEIIVFRAKQEIEILIRYMEETCDIAK